MGAIAETMPGGPMVCLLDFSARPRDVQGQPIQGPRREFRVGERVRFIAGQFVGKPEDNPTGWMAVFEPLQADGHQYSAIESYFVTEDCWEGLRNHFAKSLVVTLETDRGAGLAKKSSYKLVPAGEASGRKAR